MKTCIDGVLNDLISAGK